MAGVAVEVGVEFADHRQLQLARRGQRRPAERAFGDQLDDVRPLARPAPQQELAGRQAELQLGVLGERDAAGQHLFEAVSGPGTGFAALVGLAWADQVNPVAGSDQPSTSRPVLMATPLISGG
jgi:hypothetical protein